MRDLTASLCVIPDGIQAERGSGGYVGIACASRSRLYALSRCSRDVAGIVLHGR